MTDDKPLPGFCIPSHRSAFPPDANLFHELRRVVETGAEQGFHSAWTWDHMLPAPAFYSTAWYESFAALAASSGAGLQMGTGILIAPTRNPILTATQISTIQQMSGLSMLLGVGTGWHDKEFEAAQVEKRDRGRITDEFLDVVTMMFDGGGTYHGRHFRFDDIDPGPLGVAPQILVAGGSQIKHDKSVEKPVLAKGVARRILKHGRWLIRPSASPEAAAEDLQLLRQHADAWEVSPSIGLSHVNVMHLVETDDPEEARRVQSEYFYRMMSSARGFDYFESCYVVGTIAEIRARVQAWQNTGLEHLSFYPLGDFCDQLRLWRKHLGDLMAFSD